MARAKTASASTALVTTSTEPKIINAARKLDPRDPHSLLELVGDPPGTKGNRVMFGILQSRYRGHDNSAASFVAAKLRPSWSADPHAATAAWAETLAPPDADDSFADATLLAARIDREIARNASGEAPLLAYATITDPEACRVHAFREELRSVARSIVDSHGGPVIAVVHAPGRAGNGNPVHGHLCIAPFVVDGPLGFSTRISAFCSGKGRAVIIDAWANRRRFM